MPSLPEASGPSGLACGLPEGPAQPTAHHLSSGNMALGRQGAAGSVAPDCSSLSQSAPRAASTCTGAPRSRAAQRVLDLLGGDSAEGDAVQTTVQAGGLATALPASSPQPPPASLSSLPTAGILSSFLRRPAAGGPASQGQHHPATGISQQPATGSSQQLPSSSLQLPGSSQHPSATGHSQQLPSADSGPSSGNGIKGQPAAAGPTADSSMALLKELDARPKGSLGDWRAMLNKK